MNISGDTISTARHFEHSFHLLKVTLGNRRFLLLSHKILNYSFTHKGGQNLGEGDLQNNNLAAHII